LPRLRREEHGGGSLVSRVQQDAPEPRGPIIVAEFNFDVAVWQVVLWPETADEEMHWDVVRADLPYIWREHATFSEDFGL
jgi:hypothetical protein